MSIDTWISRTTPAMERRLKVAHIHTDVMMNTLCLSSVAPYDTVVKLSLDVDPGTQVIDRFYDHSHQCEAIILYNPNWPSVPNGEFAPIITPRTSYVLVDYRVVRTDEETTQPLALQPGVDPFESRPEDYARYDNYVKLSKSLHVTPMGLSEWTLFDIRLAQGFRETNKGRSKPVSYDTFVAMACVSLAGTSTFVPKEWSDEAVKIMDGKVNLSDIPNFEEIIEKYRVSESDIKVKIGPPIYGGLFEGANETVEDVHMSRKIAGLPPISDEEAADKIKSWRNKPPML